MSTVPKSPDYVLFFQTSMWDRGVYANLFYLLSGSKFKIEFLSFGVDSGEFRLINYAVCSLYSPT